MAPKRFEFPEPGTSVCIEWWDAVSDFTEIAHHESSGLAYVRTWGELLDVLEPSGKHPGHVRVGSERLDNSTGSITYRAVTTVPLPWLMVVTQEVS